MIFEIVYRREGYTLADAMRPDPFWGRRIFRADSEKIGTESVEAVRQMAIETPPDRYEFWSVQALPGGKLLFKQDLGAANTNKGGDRG